MCVPARACSSALPLLGCAAPASSLLAKQPCSGWHLRTDHRRAPQVNYHYDKEARARAVFGYYLENDSSALRAFPGGSEPGS